MVGGVFSFFGIGNVPNHAVKADVSVDRKSNKPNAPKISGMQQCQGCGEERKTTQGLCTVCFMNGSVVSLPRFAAHQDASVNEQQAPGPSRRKPRSHTIAVVESCVSNTAVQSSPSNSRPTSGAGRPSSRSGAIGNLVIRQPERIPFLNDPGERDGGLAKLLNESSYKRAPSSLPAKDALSEIKIPPKRRQASSDPVQTPSTPFVSHRASRAHTMFSQPSDNMVDIGAERASPQTDSILEVAHANPSRSRGPRSYRKGEGSKSRRVKRDATNIVDAVEPAKVNVQPKHSPSVCFRNGDRVRSCISRTRNGLEILDVGNEGQVIRAMEVPTDGTAGKMRSQVLVQFDSGFDWLLASHQVCHHSQFKEIISLGLPGGFKWGDKVQSLISMCQPSGAKRSLCLGDTGVVIGPGAVAGKVAIRFGSDGAERSLWPTAVCREEAYMAAVSCALAGGFRRGDNVRSSALAPAGASTKDGACLKDGHKGTVIGPGHTEGRLLVCFDGSYSSWSDEPAMLVLDNKSQSRAAKSSSNEGRKLPRRAEMYEVS
eukprot:TRINITY_DN34799_c0_g1_i1.p1 TRINITY_DN34799_c0_g1~~TRINITY_DN34799_c0_g1_i1.p1  ORF type:complete len:543 (-),score=58.42 TRINITY_DN34799_c0_g1_i1:40-1668(-)